MARGPDLPAGGQLRLPNHVHVAVTNQGVIEQGVIDIARPPSTGTYL